MPHHPLDDAFDMEKEEVSSVLGTTIEIPDDPSMDTVVKLALQQYKEIVEEAAVLEAEDRIRQLELAKQFLDLARETMKNHADLTLRHEKMVADAEAKMNKGQQKSIPGEKPAVSRSAVLQKIKEKKASG